MRKLERPKSPDFLNEEIQTQLGERYQRNREINSGHQFNYWHTEKVGESSLYLELKKELGYISDNHCFYCDNYPPLSDDDTIDHFKPKSRPEFYHLVCAWNNLYLACGHCQKSKFTQYDDLLLRPDEIDYSFDKYFNYNFDNDEILINPQADDISKERAEITLRVFDFNHVGLKKLRYYFRKLFDKDPTIELTDLPFRFCLTQTV